MLPDVAHKIREGRMKAADQQERGQGPGSSTNVEGGWEKSGIKNGSGGVKAGQQPCVTPKGAGTQQTPIMRGRFATAYGNRTSALNCLSPSVWQGLGHLPLELRGDS